MQHWSLMVMLSPQHFIYKGFTIFSPSVGGVEEGLFKACIFQDLCTKTLSFLKVLLQTEVHI